MALGPEVEERMNKIADLYGRFVGHVGRTAKAVSRTEGPRRPKISISHNRENHAIFDQDPAFNRIGYRCSRIPVHRRDGAGRDHRLFSQ
jgi:hypothetical protein